MLTYSDLDALTRRVKYKDWTLSAIKRGGVLLIRWDWRAPCAVNGGSAQRWSSREWFIHDSTTEEGVVRAAFAAAKMAEEHECAENFRFDGVMVFDPHKEVL